ncbi:MULTISPECIES: hypothetical protein [Vibrio harveyi group]|uniref:Uncharacterized protein n=1 Tax=Vibrio jasicida TaxID=766224 RepID=A0AAU9QHU5_9VIBR|nr:MULTISPECIES: hypothetical protein [Vibrio harveyi group]CAH1526266.1 conserved hypothetical protein [Vibrio jasicida]CAH1564803.1 conserved hypothetical protein [Vibrio jasicida]CAH1573903.1 conserved hypothetical protein [Vibrio jasicida]
MKEKHKSMLWTAVIVLFMLAVINNVGALESLKKQINGDSGWF